MSTFLIYQFLLPSLIIFLIYAVYWGTFKYIDRAYIIFRDDLKNAILHSQPVWSDIKRIGILKGLNEHDVHLEISKIHSEILIGREKNLKDFEPLIRGYLQEYDRERPFVGIPDKIRVHLELLRVKNPNDEGLLTPLVDQIKDLVVINNKEKTRLRNLAVGSFVVGVIGLLFAFYVYFNPHP